MERGEPHPFLLLSGLNCEQEGARTDPGFSHGCALTLALAPPCRPILTSWGTLPGSPNCPNTHTAQDGLAMGLRPLVPSLDPTTVTGAISRRPAGHLAGLSLAHV